jgi:MFS superfamily sulfate permease-like transporter
MDNDVVVAVEKPQNGIAGLKHWRHDLLAGLVVSMISVPFSLGIAVASGAPPICGLISAIIAGLVLPFLGGSYVTVSGPAAGLAPALLAAMVLLGRGDLAIGYPLLLVAICLTGFVQVILARMKMARFSSLFPSSVVEGMLASIGLLIIAKQLPLLVGHKFEAHEFWGIVAEAPSRLMAMEPRVFALGIATLALIFVLASFKAPAFKVVPPQVIAAVFGLVLGRMLGLRPEHLINIPDQPFKHGFVLPNFQGVLSDHTLWWAVFVTVVTLTLIDGVESLATIAAIDKIDPFKRKSDPNRTLFAMGVSNMCSSMAGGLTIIPGGVKSTACIVGGGRTQWANFYNAMFLIVYIVVGRSVINMMPLSVLGAIVIYTGYKLCAPKVWKHVAHIGSEQLFVFTATVLATLTTDLLVGIAFGMFVKLALEVWIEARVERAERADGIGSTIAHHARHVAELFRNPVAQSVATPEGYHLYFARPLVCFNTLHLNNALSQVPTGVSTVYLHVTDMVTIMDHTATSTLLEFVEEFKRSGRGIVQILGLEKLRPRSHAHACMRLSYPVSARERAEALQTLSKLGLTAADSPSSDVLQKLDHLSLSHSEVVSHAGEHPISGAVLHAGGLVAGGTRRLTAQLARNVLDGDDPHGKRRDLHWMGLCERTGESPTDLGFLSMSDCGLKRAVPEKGTQEATPRM